MRNILHTVIQNLHREFPETAFVLFGSRAKGDCAKYSDWDIGVFSRRGLRHTQYRRMLVRKSELSENLPFMVDLVNLNNANGSFLKEISQHWRLLAGNREDLKELERKSRS